MSTTQDKLDAARWRYFRAHAYMVSDEDGGLGLGMTLAEEETWDVAGKHPFLTPRERKELRAQDPGTFGVVKKASTINKAIDSLRKA